MKRFLVAVAVIIAAAAALIIVYRYQILQYSAESAIRRILPDYVKIDKIVFDARAGRLILNGFKIVNPPHFSNRYLLEIEELSCKYRLKGKNILDGLEVFDPLIKNLTIHIERGRNGKTNMEEMSRITARDASVKKEKAGEAQGDMTQAIASKALGSRKLSKVVVLPEHFPIRDSKAIIIDRFVGRNPHIITFEKVDTDVSLRLDDNYTKLLELASTGEGVLNGNSDQRVRWTVLWNPTTAGLTMSNRFEVSRLDITVFEPYYDKYSPFVFKQGRFSGLLIFDFDNDNIGSTNEIMLSDLIFYIKRGHENATILETTVPDLAKYFSTPYGDIVFDFKIKGTMQDPQFYLGPISKRALTAMAVDKISQIIEKTSGPGGQPGAAKSDIEKAKEYIDLFKGLIKK